MIIFGNILDVNVKILTLNQKLRYLYIRNPTVPNIVDEFRIVVTSSIIQKIIGSGSF